MKIIAEISINHGGSFSKAVEMIQEAKRCGANAVKFQLYFTDVICLNRNCFEVYEVLERNKMHASWVPLLKEECDHLGIEFMCTPFCKYSAEYIASCVDSFKVASPEVCDLKFIKHLATYKKPLILSTGKATFEHLDSIFESVTVPITLLYCISKYPAMPGDYNLSTIGMLKSRYKCPVGLSDHTQGLKVSKLAMDKDISVIERHFKTSNKCIDAAVSISPKELLELTEYAKKLGFQTR